jgi:hypothetical protein
MQKLALMMAVMMLGMSPAHGCDTSIDLGSQGAGGQAEMILPPSTWSGSDGEALARIRNEVLRIGQGAAKENPEERECEPGSGEKGQDNRPEREAAQKATEALKKGADATRGRGQRKSRLYQGAGARN